MIKSIDEAVAKYRNRLNVIVLSKIHGIPKRNVVYTSYNLDTTMFLGGVEVGCIIIEPRLTLEDDFNFQTLEFLFTRFRCDKVIRYQLEDGSIIYEGDYD